jgi:iron-sulfur cluster insertion protein
MTIQLQQTANQQALLDEKPMATKIQLTEAAARRIKRYIDEEQNPKLMLRAAIQGGGCSGLKYDLELVEEQNDDDWVIETTVANEGGMDPCLIKLVVDPLSMQYYAGAIIDYKIDISGEQFIVRNPNAKTTCGCGSSFSD